MIKRKPLHGVSVWANTWALLAVLGVIFTSATAAAQPAETWRTGQTVSYVAGDDGALQRGAAWPVPRFTDNGDGTVSDRLTGLIWLKNANCFGSRTWTNALSVSNSLASGSCGLSDGSVAGDWRLPNRKELFSLIDYSRFNPALPLGHPFTNMQSTYYWSASTRADNTSIAWIVRMDYGYVEYHHSKAYNRYVWPVRGGQGGSFGDLAYLDISQIASPQQLNDPFEVTITAVGNNGQRMTAINGAVRLASSAGDNTVSPMSIPLVNGQWQGSVRVLGSGENIRLRASYRGVTGASNYFDVAGTGSGLGHLMVQIRDHHDEKVAYDVEITLDGPEFRLMESDSGDYEFLNLKNGEYVLTARRLSDDLIIGPLNLYVIEDGCAALNIEFPAQASGDNRLVLLVPGIMGSTRATDQWLPPRLPPSQGADASELKVLNNKRDWLGWRELSERLANEDIYPIPVPYDWRMDINKIVKSYLIPAIDKFKAFSPDGKVDIIAHSMGGLVVRAYIQNDEHNFISRNDIGRFAMVGTPNEGAAAPYYIWQGGDPKLADDILKTGVWLQGNFYWTVTKENYKITLGSTVKSNDHLSIFNYYRDIRFHSDEITGVRQLLPTYDFLIKDNNDPASLVREKNNFLIDLNTGVHSSNKDRMGAQNDPVRVQTIVFAGENQNTIKEITVGERANLFYRDGQPMPRKTSLLNPHGSAEMSSEGDNTVLLSSAQMPSNEGWASQGPTRNTGHAYLIKAFVPELVSFVQGEFVSSHASVMSYDYRPFDETPDNLLAISLEGRVQGYLSNPQGLKTGVNYQTRLYENNIPDADASFLADAGSIVVSNPSNGTYTLYITGNVAEDYLLSLSFSAGEAEPVTHSFHGFNNAETVQLQFTLNADLDEPIVFDGLVAAPEQARADVHGTDVLATGLSWTAAEDPDVVGYRVYSRQMDEPKLALIATTQEPLLTTEYPWAGDLSIPVRLFAVTAVRSDGIESFLSDTFKNDDRDHDGLTDAVELEFGSDMTLPDTDGDGLSDYEEFIYGTSPVLVDTDGDGACDFTEVQWGSDPLDPNSFPHYTVTPIFGANGTMHPDDLQTVDHGATISFTVTPDPGYTAVVSGTCGGALAGDQYTTDPITTDCTVEALFAVVPPPMTIYVDASSATGSQSGTPEDPFTTIGQAIAFAGPGDTITVAAGTYAENLVVDKNLNLIGEDRQSTIIDGGDAMLPVVRFSGVAAGSIEGFWIRNGTGAGIHCEQSVLTIADNIVSHVVAQNGQGDGIWVGDNAAATIRHNLIYTNDVSGIAIAETGAADIVNNTIVDNGAYGIASLAGAAVSIRNNIIVQNGLYGILCEGAAAPVIAYNDVWSNYIADYLNCGPGEGNIGQDPLFVSADAADYRLTVCSPAIDAGDPASDFSLEPLPNGGRINMGAFGGTMDATTSVAGSADLDNDGDVDGFDLYLFLQQFGNMDCAGCPQDLNMDGVVDQDDLEAFLCRFGR